MAIYRVLVELATKTPTPRGYIGPLRLSETKLQALLDKGRIAEVAPVPLAIFGPRWRDRLQQLGHAGIETVVDLLSRDAAELCELTPEGAEEIARWQDEVREYLAL